VKEGLGMDLKEKIRNLPSCPGVYLMKDSNDCIIYVGKSKNLRSRVQSYFSKSKGHSPKVEKLVSNLKDFDFILTDTEFEAFMLECKLIKEIKPFYNKKMKNPLSYVFIEIQMIQEYPSLETTNNPIENVSNLYFGPYTNKNTVQRAIQGIKECCRIVCSNPSKNKTTCLNYSLGACIGMCQGGIAAEQYRNIIDRIIALLNGSDKSILQEMEQRMLAASQKLDFNTAAKYRDYIDLTNFLINREKIIEFTEENKNIVMVEHLNCNSIKLFLIHRNNVLFSEKYNLIVTDIGQLLSIIKRNILVYFKTNDINSSLKVTSDEIDEALIIYNYLKYSTCSYFIIPEKWFNSEDSSNLDESLINLLNSLTIDSINT
jgi:excinuclease ABC subunit C